MTWISTIPYAEANGRLRSMYDRIKGPDDNVDNIMLAHSLRPHTLEGHMTLYKHVLRHSANRVPRWLMEAVGAYVSAINGCDYCFEHHHSGMARLLDDDSRAAAIGDALKAGKPEATFAGRELVALKYAAALTRDPAAMSVKAVDDLRVAGFGDGEILELNQIVAYFAYANRTVLGLGVTTEGDEIGLSPSQSNDPENWSHS